MYSGTFQPKNPTTARKPGNDMKKNAGLPKMGNNPAANQRDVGLDFNGQNNGSSQRSGQGRQYAHNMHSGTSNDDQGHNQRQMPNRTGNVTGKTANGGTATAPILGHTGMPIKGPSNPDKIQNKQLVNRVGNKCD
jgi:hypothetical protein